MKYAIVLSGHTMALGVVRSLGTSGVPIALVHYDEKDTANYSRYVTHSIDAPHPVENEAQFVEVLVKHADRFSGGVILPASDETVVAVSRHKHILEKHYIVACPEWDIVRQYIDKSHTYALAEKHGIPAPKTIEPESLKDVEEYCKTAEFPCLVKPRQSNLFYEYFKCKMFPVNSVEQMISVYKKTEDAGLKVLLQEIIPGDDADVVNYNAYFDNGQPLVEFTAQHIRNAPPWWGSPRVAKSARIPEVVEPGRKILKAMKFYGYACTEFKRDSRDGIYKLMEVNGRHNLSTLLAVRCGINFPWLQYQHCIEGKMPAPMEFETGIYWVDITRDVGYSFKHMSDEKYSWRDYLRPYIKPHVFAIFDWKDMKPFMKRCAYLFAQGLKGGWKKLRRTNGNVTPVKYP